MIYVGAAAATLECSGASLGLWSKPEGAGVFVESDPTKISRSTEGVSMSIQISLKTVAIFAGLGVAGLIGFVPALGATNPPKPAISEEASTAVAQMGKSLQAEQFSFQARTLRVYADTNGQPLHIGSEDDSGNA
jgi:hypothetical protein